MTSHPLHLDRSRPLLIRLLLLAVLVVLAPVALMSLHAVYRLEPGLTPEMDKKAAIVGRDMAAQVERAVGYGIPIDRLVGVEDFFAPVMAANPEIRYLAVTDRLGRVLYLSGVAKDEIEPSYRNTDFEISESLRKANVGAYVDVALPVSARGERLGQVHVGMGADYILGRLVEIFKDVAMVLIVALVVSYEMLLFVVTYNISAPMKLAAQLMERGRRGDFTHVAEITSGDEVGRFVRALNAAIRAADELFRKLDTYISEIKAAHFDKTVIERVTDIEARVKFLFRFDSAGELRVMPERRATDVRLPLFLFVFSEEMSRAFMPLYVAEFGATPFGLAPEMVAAIPIAVFMAFIALASPWGGLITDRLGSQRVFLIGLVPAVIGYVMTGFAFGVVDLVVWRAATGIGYALITMACQGYISRTLGEGGRAKGLGVFVGAILTASVCGTALGGVLADHLGFRATFFVSAALALLSGVLVGKLLHEDRRKRHQRETSAGDLFALLKNWRFAFLVVFAAVPSKMALTGFMFFLVPILLDQAGNDVAAIARMMMIYPVVVAIILPTAGRLSDALGWRAGLVALGGVIGGAGLVLPALVPGSWPVMLGIIALGISHGLSAAPQLALVPDICWIECRNLGQTNVLAFLRTLERIGSTTGPLLAAAFIPFWGAAGAIMALGVVVLGMAAVFALGCFAYGSGPHIETEETP